MDPVVGIIYLGMEETVWDQTEGPRIADQEKDHLATLLKDYCKFLVRKLTIKKTTTKQNTYVCHLMYCF